jgi:hypothetical protein
LSKRPVLINPNNGEAAGFSAAQRECVDKLREVLASAEAGEIHACAIIACGPSDFGLVIAGADAPRLNLGLDVAKAEIMSRVLGPKRSVLHR